MQESLRLFSDARRRAKKIKFSGKLKRRVSKAESSKEIRLPTTFSSSTLLWTRRRHACTDDEDEGEEVEVTLDETLIETEETVSRTTQRPGEVEEEGVGGLEKATGILKSIFGLQ